MSPSPHKETRHYFAALKTNGVTATLHQQRAFDNFVRIGKLGGWLSGIQRLFIPVWGSNAANAVDAILPSRSGTWVGTVNPTGKAATGDGTTGYLDMVCNTATTGMNTGQFWMAVHQLAGGVGMSRTEIPIGGAISPAQHTVARYSNLAVLTSGTTLPLTQAAGTTVGLTLGYRNVANRGIIAYDGVIGATHQTAPAEAFYSGAIYGMAIINGSTPSLHSDRPTVLLAAGNNNLTPAQAEGIAIQLHTLVTKLRA
jgi:hypothetical protein